MKRLEVAGASARLTSDGLAGHTYQLQRARDGDPAGPWNNALSPIPGAESEIAFTVPYSGRHAFHRVVLGP